MPNLFGQSWSEQANTESATAIRTPVYGTAESEQRQSDRRHLMPLPYPTVTPAPTLSGGFST